MVARLIIVHVHASMPIGYNIVAAWEQECIPIPAPHTVCCPHYRRGNTTEIVSMTAVTVRVRLGVRFSFFFPSHSKDSFFLQRRYSRGWGAVAPNGKVKKEKEKKKERKKGTMNNVILLHNI